MPNPIEAVQGPPADVASNSSFVCIGRLSFEKGGTLLAHAACELGIPLTFVGDGPMKDDIVRAYPEATFTGWLNSSSVGMQMQQARALVLPSLCYETQGLVVSEAAARGLPAIVPDRCAARDTVVDGVTGLWFRSGDHYDLRDKLRFLHERPELAARMGRAAYERFWANPPTVDRHVVELEAVYNMILGGGSQNLEALAP